jgi:hypothetical protein
VVARRLNLYHGGEAVLTEKQPGKAMTSEKLAEVAESPAETSGVVPPETSEMPAKTGELFPKAAKPGDKQEQIRAILRNRGNQARPKGVPKQAPPATPVEPLEVVYITPACRCSDHPYPHVHLPFAPWVAEKRPGRKEK